MKAKTPKPATLRITAQQYASRRRYLTEAMERVESGEDLDQCDRLIIGRLGRSILEGNDPRIEYGVKPKRGAKESKATEHKILALHYWMRRNARWKEDAARDEVCRVWGRKSRRVSSIVTEYKQRAVKLLQSMTDEQVLVLVQHNAKFPKELDAL